MKPIHIAVMTNPENQTQFTAEFFRAEISVTDWFSYPQQFETYTRAHDIVLIDTGMTKDGVIRTIKILITKWPQIKIIAVCSDPDIDQARALIDMGVTGILLHDELACNLAYCIQTVFAGRIVISSAILKKLLD